MEQMSQALHDLCQPLTTLQCRLELAGIVGSDSAYRDAVRLGLVECERLRDMAIAMRELVHGAMAEDEPASNWDSVCAFSSPARS